MVGVCGGGEGDPGQITQRVWQNIYTHLIGQPVRRRAGKMDSSAITNLFGVWINFRTSPTSKCGIPSQTKKVRKAPLSVGHISVYHDSYTISAKCSTRMNKERKAKECCSTKTESYTVNKPADANGRVKFGKQGSKGGVTRQHGISRTTTNL